MNNTIILKKYEAGLTNREYKEMNCRHLCVEGYEGKELARWNIEDIDIAKKELAKYTNKRSTNGSVWDIEEYILMYCECDEDGELIDGGDYDIAEDENPDEGMVCFSGKEINIKEKLFEIIKNYGDKRVNVWERRVYDSKNLPIASGKACDILEDIMDYYDNSFLDDASGIKVDDGIGWADIYIELR